MNLGRAEYIWLDGAKPTQKTRSKTRVINWSSGKPKLSSFPEWGYDGSSTYQAPGNKSDLVLKPVSFVHDPLRGPGNYLVMCEVYNSDDSPHETNSRAKLRKVLDEGAAKCEAWFGFEQEYTFFHGERPLGWPDYGYPAPQGPFYCGVGPEAVHGREIVEEHAEACMDAGIMIYGTNAEVMPGQWEYQIGYRGIEGESADPLTVSDHLWMARWLMERICEKYGVSPKLDCKPMKGDWNGAGAHTNISTKDMRDPKTGWTAIQDFISKLSANHAAHIAVYGTGLEDRLTGHHETCDINTFKSGDRDRGASIRIPDAVARKKYGYIEDRRPGANCDPYSVCARMLRTLISSEKSAGKSKSDSKFSAAAYA